MFNTVPHGVSLTEEITLLPAKAEGVQLTIERDRLVFKAGLRVCETYIIFYMSADVEK